LQTADYLRLNPNARIPTLIDGDVVIWESMAINIYLSEKYEGPMRVVARIRAKSSHMGSFACLTPHMLALRQREWPRRGRKRQCRVQSSSVRQSLVLPTDGTIQVHARTQETGSCDRIACPSHYAPLDRPDTMPMASLQRRSSDRLRQRSRLRSILAAPSQ